jgi:uncharacterized protein YodC (DUF2158 family)
MGDGKKEYDETSEEQEHGDVEWQWYQSNCVQQAVFLGAEKQT